MKAETDRAWNKYHYEMGKTTYVYNKRTRWVRNDWAVVSA